VTVPRIDSQVFDRSRNSGALKLVFSLSHRLLMMPINVSRNAKASSLPEAPVHYARRTLLLIKYIVHFQGESRGATYKRLDLSQKEYRKIQNNNDSSIDLLFGFFIDNI